MKKTAIRITQLFILAVIRLVYFRRVRSYMDAEDSKTKRPVVIAVNHANRLDPFVVACFLPLSTIWRVFPYKFMTANVYYYRWWKPLAWLAGCYPAKPRYDGERRENYGVGYSVRALEDGYSVMMFPEGRRTGQQLEARPGISRILMLRPSRLILCHIEWTPAGRPRIIRISLKAADDSLDISKPDEIMKAVYAVSARQHKVRAAERLVT